MTEYRRQDDKLGGDMSPAHEFMLTAISKLDSKVNEHIHPEIGRIIDALEGPLTINLDGTEHRDGGLIADVHENTEILTEVRHNMRNGGFKMRMSKSLVAILVAIIGLIGTVGVAVINQAHATDAEITRVVQQVINADSAFHSP